MRHKATHRAAIFAWPILLMEEIFLSTLAQKPVTRADVGKREGICYWKGVAGPLLLRLPPPPPLPLQFFVNG